tara:strand:+ start:352 stop:1779 length:1428 start_codon:yes stop_codon:yes gene_type:complete
MSTKINRNLPNNAYQAAVNADSPSAINPYATIDDLPTSGASNQLISGGAIYSGTGMVFDVSALVYLIGGIEYTSAETSVTLAIGDATNPRFDAIVVDESEVVSVIQGTPASDPITPSIGVDQVLVQYVLIGIGATTPDITTELIYQDFAPVYWVRGSAGINNITDFNSSTPTPPQGSSCILTSIGQYGKRRGVSFSTASPVSRSEYVQLSFRVNFPQSLVDQGVPYFKVWMFGDNTPGDGPQLGSVELTNYCDASLADTWQLVSIPTSFFVDSPDVDTIAYLNFSVWRGSQFNPPSLVIPSVEFALDDIKLQTGIAPPVDNTFTIDVLNRSTVVGSTSRLNFVPTQGHTNRIVDNPTSNDIALQLNVAGVDSQVTAGATLNINADSTSMVTIDAQDVSFIIDSPTGNPVNGQKLLFRMLDDGNASLVKNITWSAIYEPIGVTLPTNLTASKLLYVGCIYNSNSGKWNVIAVTEEA